jgi:hypothetical protein
MTRRSEHHPVAAGHAESGVRGAVVLADVGLDLDDPPDPPAGLVIADQPDAEECAAGVERGPGEACPIDDRQPARA